MIGSTSLDGGRWRNVADRGAAIGRMERIGTRPSAFWDTTAAQIAAFGDTIVRQNGAPVSGFYYAGVTPQASNVGQAVAATGSAFGYALGQQVGAALTEFVGSDEGKAFFGKVVSAGARAISGLLGAWAGAGAASAGVSAAGGAAAVGAAAVNAAGSAAAGVAASAGTGAGLLGGVASAAEGVAELALPLIA